MSFFNFKNLCVYLVLTIVVCLCLLGCSKSTKVPTIITTKESMVVPSLKNTDVEPIKLRKFNFVENTCVAKNTQVYACITQESLDNLLYDLKYLKVRNSQLRERISVYQTYYTKAVKDVNK